MNVMDRVLDRVLQSAGFPSNEPEDTEYKPKANRHDYRLNGHRIGRGHPTRRPRVRNLQEPHPLSATLSPSLAAQHEKDRAIAERLDTAYNVTAAANQGLPVDEQVPWIFPFQEAARRAARAKGRAATRARAITRRRSR